MVYKPFPGHVGPPKSAQVELINSNLDLAGADGISETLAIIDLRSRWTYGDHCWSLAGGTDSVLTQGRIDAGSRLA